MDYLWTPWRYQYVTRPGGTDECVFCAAGSSADDCANLVVHRGEYNYVIVNRFPYTSGHLMVVPFAHVSTLLETSVDAATEMMMLARRCEKHLREVYRPEGLNFGINLGKSAGAGIAGHLHMHALPRWTGDTNFMTVVGETRVLPEDLKITWERVRAAFAA
jgi:ATP adenylyltransferase